jgi:hypothetical protein
MIHMPVSVGSESSRRDRPITAAPSRTFTRRHLVGVTQIGAERIRDAQPRGDHACDVGRGVTDLLDRARDQ